VIDNANIFAVIGLVIISIGWLLQIIYSWDGKRKIRKRTLIFYNIGVAVLIIHSVFVLKVIDSIAILNIITIVLVSILLIRISKSDVKEEKNIRTARRKKKI